MHKDKVAPPPAETTGATVDYFASGIAAMHVNGQWDLANKNATCNFPFDIGYLPIVKDKRGVTGGSGFCISASTKYKEEAWKWLKMFTSADVLSVMVGRTGRGIPARWSATPVYLEAGGRAAHPSVFIEQLKWAFNDRSVVAFYEFIDSYNRNLAPIFTNGEGDIGAALAKTEEETNAAMTEKRQGCTLAIS
jgi:ABC-type glycerol-3-phosphate transport system substrate-binding protein